MVTSISSWFFGHLFFLLRGNSLAGQKRAIQDCVKFVQEVTEGTEISPGKERLSERKTQKAPGVVWLPCPLEPVSRALALTGCCPHLLLNMGSLNGCGSLS